MIYSKTAFVLEVPVKLTHQGRSKLTRVIAGERCIKFIH